MFFKKRDNKPQVPQIRVEQQLADLASAGINLRADRTPEEIENEWGTSAYEREPYILLLDELAGTFDHTIGDKYYSDDIYLLYREDTNETGHYTHELKQFQRIAKGSLPFTYIADTLDQDAKQGTIVVELEGERLDYRPSVEEENFDLSVLTWLAEILAALESPLRFVRILTDDPDEVLVACILPEEAQRLAALIPNAAVTVLG